MQELKIALLQEPFPHAVIDDFYDEKELKLIWQELDYYTYSDKLVPASTLDGAILNGESLPKHNGIQLDELYQNNRKISNILQCNRKLFNKDILESFASLSPLIWDIKEVSHDITLIKYYEDTDYYKAHKDEPRFTCLTYLHKEPKAFTGGDLHFHQFNYTIPIVNNRLIFFTGCIEHASTTISMNDDYKDKEFSGFGKYTITQFLGSKTGG
jgi:Rps23 Pro-64 3,4-dihydroxylase Tpa1-like proline 4-hydroxylase